MAQAKRIYILIIKVDKLFSFFSSRCFLKEIENMYSAFLSSYRNTRESLGEFEKAVGTRAAGECFHSFLSTFIFSAFNGHMKVFLTMILTCRLMKAMWHDLPERPNQPRGAGEVREGKVRGYAPQENIELVSCQKCDFKHFGWGQVLQKICLFMIIKWLQQEALCHLFRYYFLLETPQSVSLKVLLHVHKF